MTAVSPRLLVVLGLALTTGTWLSLVVVLGSAPATLTGAGADALLLVWTLGWLGGPGLVLLGGQGMDAAVLRGPRVRCEAPGFLSGAVGAAMLGLLLVLGAAALASVENCRPVDSPCPPGSNCTTPLVVGGACVNWMVGFAGFASVFGFFGVVAVIASGSRALWEGRRPGPEP